MVLRTDFALDDPLGFQDVNETNTQVNTNTAAIAALQSGVFPILLADPGSPAVNTWWVRRDGGSPEGLQIRVCTESGVETAFDYTLATT